MSLPRLMFDPTTPDGIVSCTVNFSGSLPDGVTLVSASVSCAVHDQSVGADDDADERVSTPATVDGTFVSVTFSDGVAGADYVLTYLPTLSDGEIDPVQVIMPVRKYI